LEPGGAVSIRTAQDVLAVHLAGIALQRSIARDVTVLTARVLQDLFYRLERRQAGFLVRGVYRRRRAGKDRGSNGHQSRRRAQRVMKLAHGHTSSHAL